MPAARCGSARYMERIENLARLLDVTKTFAGDAEGGRNWLSLLRINGDEAAFFAKHAAPEAASVAQFYLLDSGEPDLGADVDPLCARRMRARCGR